MKFLFFVCYFLICYKSSELSSINFEYCEHAIIMYDNKPRITLFCQATKQYENCTIGTVYGNTRIPSTYCTFYKARFTRYGGEFFMVKKCVPENFVRQISYGGIYQSAKGCKITIKEFDQNRHFNYFSPCRYHLIQLGDPVNLSSIMTQGPGSSV